MTNIFQRLDVAVSADGIAGDLAGQIQKITAIAQTLQSLIDNPPDEIGGVVAALGNLPLPDLSIGAGLGDAFGEIGNLLPPDVAEFTGEIQVRLDNAQELVADINGSVQSVLQAAAALYRLTEIDWNCADTSVDGGSTAGGTAGGSTVPSNPEEERDGVSVTATNQVVTQTNDALDLFPSPFTIETVIDSIALLVAQDPDAIQRFLPVPVLDELIDSLNTVVAWRNMNATELQSALNNSLGSLAALLQQIPEQLLQPLGTLAADLTAELPFTVIDDALNALAAAYSELAAMVASGDLSAVTATATAADAALTQLQDLLPILSAPPRAAQLANACRRLTDLPEDLADGIERYVAILEAPPELESMNKLTENLATTISEKLPTLGDELAVDGLLEQLQELVEALDFTAVEDSVGTAASTLEDALAEIDQAFVQLGVQLQGAVGEVNDVIGAIDVGALLAETTASIDDYRVTLSDQLNTAFAPARSAIEAAVSNLDGVIGEFDPQAVIAAIESVLNDVTGVLGDSEVVALVEKIRAALEEIATQFDALRFAPLTNEVIRGIEEIDSTLREITASDIPAAAKSALQTALAVLPDSITPLTDPLIDEFGELIDAGPVRLLGQIKEQPAKAMDRVREFEPGKLVGQHLGPEFKAVLSKVEAFRPSQLFASVESEFESAKLGLAEKIDPTRALAPLQPAFDRVDALVRELDPNRLIAPLNELIASATSQVVDVLPLEEFFEQFDVVIARINAIQNSAGGVRDLLDRVVTMLDALSDPEAALDSMLDPLRVTLADIADAGFLQPGIVAVETAVGELRAVPLRSQINDVLVALESELDSLNPAVRLTELVQSHSTFPSDALHSLPDSAGKTAAVELLTRMNPLAPLFAEPLRPFVELHECIALLANRLNERFATWDTTFHAADTALGELANLDGNPTAVRSLLLDETLQQQFVQPFASVFSLLSPVALLLGALSARFSALLTAVQDQIDALTGGPDSLTSIRNSIAAVVDRFENINLDIVGEALREPTELLRSNVRALDPMALATPLRESLVAALADLSFDLIIPPEEIATVDEAFGSVIDTLRALDPERIVTEALQPEFDATVRPLIDALDVSDLLGQVAQRLDQLREELGSELDRVDVAYKQLQQGASSVSGSVSVGA